MIITSKSNHIIKYAKNIQNKKFSQKFGECFIETEKVIRDLINSKIIKTLLISLSSQNKYNDIQTIFKGEVFFINDELCKFLSETMSGSNIFAIAKIPEHEFYNNTNFLVLDNIQDPTNFGALIRSAVAFNFLNIITINCVYPYSYKVIRSSMGHVFNSNIKNFDCLDFIKFAKKNKLFLYSTNTNGKNVNSIEKINKDIALIMGNEGNGINQKLMNLSRETISIPINKNVESLNVAVAGGILMNIINSRR